MDQPTSEEQRDLHNFEVKSVTVTAGRTFNHPTERFANFRFDIAVTADFSLEADSDEAARQLSAAVERRAEQHKEDILHDAKLKEEFDAAKSNYLRAASWRKEVADLEKRISVLQKMADAIIDPCKWTSISFDERTVFCEGVLGYFSANHAIDTPSEEDRKEIIRNCFRGIERGIPMIIRLRETGPAVEAAALEELNAIPPYRLFPRELRSVKEIHPGHSDHPETGNREED